jgi:hypothetical protein
MRITLTMLICFILTNVKAQELNIESFSIKQYISNNGTVKEYNDSTRIVINKTTLIKGGDMFSVVNIQQSKVSPNKYRIYYLKPSKSGDFEFDLEQAEFDKRYNELRLKIGLSGIYGLYVK